MNVFADVHLILIIVWYMLLSLNVTLILFHVSLSLFFFSTNVIIYIEENIFFLSTIVVSLRVAKLTKSQSNYQK